MSQRPLTQLITLALPVALFVWVPVSALAQASAAAAKSTGHQKPWTTPKTPDGVPDLQGVWTNQTTQPLERPAALGAKEFYTPEELVGRQKEAASSKRTSRFGDTGAHYDSAQFAVDRGHAKMALSNRTSIIIGPEGRLPPLLPEAQKRQAAKLAFTTGLHEFDGPENRALSERCIIWPGEGPPMLPQGYNANLQIVQGSGYVAIEQEMIHDVRIIPTDPRPHAPANIRSYLGDSRGNWEGNTLVVDTTNFNGRETFRDFDASEQLHVVERFTRTSEDTILYQFTVSDASTWGKPWSGELPITKVDGKVFEYACQEGNYGIANILSGARATEAKAAEEAAKKK